MLISCKCSNFVASCTKSQLRGEDGAVTGNPDRNPAGGEVPIPVLLSQVFQQRFPRDFKFYNQFMDFFKRASGPIQDLAVVAINQRELLFGLTLDAAGHSWQLSLCINCNAVLCAKRLTAETGTPTHYLINSTLLTNSEELAQRKSKVSFSDTFEILIMDDKESDSVPAGPTNGIAASASNLSIGSLSGNPLDAKWQRILNVQAQQQARVQEEIADTNARIERYTRNQFQLLNSFREKSDQDCDMLLRRIRQMPEQASELLDHGMPPALEVAGNQPQSATARRRNTISSRRELSGPTTPTTTLNHPPNFLTLNQKPMQQQQQQQPQQPLPSASVTRRLSQFDTPPATPESTPMSVGNSPTFRQQQQTVAGGAPAQKLVTPGSVVSPSAHDADDGDDCQFDLEDVEYEPTPTAQLPSYQRNFIYQQQQFQRLPEEENSMSNDLDDIEAADEAEDALLDSSISIPGRPRHTQTQSQMMNFARSLPIEIANTPLAERAAAANNNNFVLGCEEGMDNIDIAASIQALTKSVHGEAVFGDLPRPRLRSQIEG